MLLLVIFFITVYLKNAGRVFGGENVKFSRELNRLLIHFPLFSLFSGQVPSRDHALGIVHCD